MLEEWSLLLFLLSSPIVGLLVFLRRIWENFFWWCRPIHVAPHVAPHAIRIRPGGGCSIGWSLCIVGLACSRSGIFYMDIDLVLPSTRWRKCTWKWYPWILPHFSFVVNVGGKDPLFIDFHPLGCLICKSRSLVKIISKHHSPKKKSDLWNRSCIV